MLRLRAAIDYRPKVSDRTMLYMGGEVMRLHEWAERSPVSIHTIKKRLRDGWSTRMAVRCKDARGDKELVERAKVDRFAEVAERNLAVWALRSTVKEIFIELDQDKTDDDKYNWVKAAVKREAKVVLNHMAVQQIALTQTESWFEVCSDYNNGAFLAILSDEENGAVTDMSNIVHILGRFMFNPGSKEAQEKRLGEVFEKWAPFRLLEWSNEKIVEVAEKVLNRRERWEKKIPALAQ